MNIGRTALICDFYDSNIYISLDDELKNKLKIDEPFIIIDDDGDIDIYLLDSEEFLFNTLYKYGAMEIKDWAKSYRQEIDNCINGDIHLISEEKK